MKDILQQLLATNETLPLINIIQNIGMATIFGIVIVISYWLSHTGTIYSKKFNVSLVTLSILTATVMSTIGNNITLSLGMVGALSIVRFRTAVKDSRDTIYIFWSIIIGICCGVGDYVVCGIGSGAVFLVLLIMGRVKSSDRVLVVIRGGVAKSQKIEAEMYNIFSNHANLKAKNSTPKKVEYIYELSRNQYKKTEDLETSFLEYIYKIGDIDYVNAVFQNEDIL